MAWSTRCKLAVVVAAVLTAIAIVLIVVLTMNNGGEADNGEPWETETRLPETVIPSVYDILLHPDLNAGTFTGKVNVEIELKEDRKYFVIHGKSLDINEVTLESSTSTVELKKPLLEVPKNEWWVIQPAQDPIPKGKYVLKLDFSGSLTNSIVGFYRSSYTTADNEARFIATTKFEPTYARLAFPCFDEPAMKASYKVRLVKPSSKEYIALSNSDVKSETLDSSKNLTTVEFTETVKMSSYLAAFIVCDFVKQQEESKLSSGQPVSVYARKEQIGNAQEALKVALNVTEFYSEYFNIVYPMPKVDLIAIPDFVSGAMENWGLITFRETSFLFDQNENSRANQESISETVAHELAHMWFGNLVTMKWWTDLWLNEGFATFMAQKGVDQMHPDWKYREQFVVSTLLSVLKLDSELSSHPVLQEVSNPDQITEIFDTISYDKGSSVLLMLEEFMGEENFAKGLHSYLITHQYNNAETADLWKALQDYAPEGVNVAMVMDTWTRQMGFPVVSVRQTDSGKFLLEQKRFLSNPSATYDAEESKYGYKWKIPIMYSTSLKKNNEMLWLTNESVEVPFDAGVEWIKLNHKQKGYYRVNYDKKGWEAIIKTLSTDSKNQIEAIDRAGLISDAFSLADAEVLGYETALDLTRFLCHEEEFIPWYAASTVLSELLQHLPTSNLFKDYGRKLVSSITKSVSWEVSASDSHLRRRLRATVLGLACSFDDTSALSKANKLFGDWLNGGDKPDPDIRSVVYQHGLGNSSDENQWNLLYTKFKTETNTQEKLKLMYALATTANESLLKRYLNDSMDENIIRSQDFFTVWKYIAENPLGVQLVWDAYREHYDYLVKRFTLNDRVFGRFIASLATKFDSQTRLNELNEFFEKYPEAGAGKAARSQALEGVTNRIKWLDTHKDTVETWLKQNVNVCLS